MILVLGILKASMELLGIGIGVKKVVLLMSDTQYNQSFLNKKATSVDGSSAKVLCKCPFTTFVISKT